MRACRGRGEARTRRGRRAGFGGCCRVPLRRRARGGCPARCGPPRAPRRARNAACTKAPRESRRAPRRPIHHRQRRAPDEPRPDRHLPIDDYALIGNTHSAALLAPDGSVDWCCLPHFDSGAVFCRLLDLERGGFLRLGPQDLRRSTRCWAGTPVLETEHETATGRVRSVDFMPVPRLAEDRLGQEDRHCRLMRRLECVSGRVTVMLEFWPTFDFARSRARWRPPPTAPAPRPARRAACTCAWCRRARWRSATGAPSAASSSSPASGCGWSAPMPARRPPTATRRSTSRPRTRWRGRSTTGASGTPAAATTGRTATRCAPARRCSSC
ncbi:MAG: DUF5911 domain-containing protein [Comamonadaceae bacterium]|nr:DUF5911 domain-containing protein [Comamonadaceae bacterium]